MYVKGKSGELVPFKLNQAQRYIHSQLEKQLATHGWVRALILKGRQQGASTYVNARFYHKAVRTPGRSVFILSHEGRTTDKLFDMVRRFQDNVSPALRPEEGKSNTRQMTFPKMNSDYAAATAGNEQAGRGFTAQLFHGSEVAYYEHAYAIQDGALKSIALAPGTEIILESTAFGPVGFFYEKCQQALHGQGDYILIFVPWYWQEEYERPDDGTELTLEEKVYAVNHFSKAFPFAAAPISLERARRKMLWRRAEIVDLSTGNNPETGKAKFRTIYPSNPIEAFLSTGVGIVRPDAIEAARRAHTTLVDEVASRIAGVDPAGDGKKSDRTVITIRQGRKVERVLKYPTMRPMELAGICARLITESHLDMMFVDRGYGEGTIDRLHELGFRTKVIGIAFNERSLYPDIYSNKRSEIIIEAAKWLNAGGVSIPDDDEIHADLAAMPMDKETSNGLKFMPPKEEIKKALGRSPDIFDSLALTFAYPVRKDVDGSAWRKVDSSSQVHKKNTGPLHGIGARRGRPS